MHPEETSQANLFIPKDLPREGRQNIEAPYFVLKPKSFESLLFPISKQTH